MKEQAQAIRICRYLDEGTDHLSYRVVERLAAARAAAVAQVAADPVAVQAPVPTPHAPAPWRPHVPGREVEPARQARTPLWWRLAATAVPLLLLLVGVFLIDTVHQEQSAAELAEVDTALLTDDVPLVAYADHGFGVYIKNTRR